MGSVLRITSVEKIQEEINALLKERKNNFIIYVSLNKSKDSAMESFEKEKIPTNKLFFIDCVNESGISKDVIYLKPNELEYISYTIKNFTKEINGDSWIIIDSLATLLIYNDTNKVAQFVKNITNLSSKKNINLMAISQKTSGEDLLNKIYNFFDRVEKK